MRFAAVAGVESVEGGGYGGVRQRFAVEQYLHFERFADIDVGGIVQRYDFQRLADLAGNDFRIGAFVADVDDVFAVHAGLFAICGVGHFGHVGLFPAVFVFGPECRAVFGSNEVAAVFNRFAALVLVIVTAFADEVFFAFFGDKLHRFAENVQTVFGNRFQFGKLAVAQFGLQIFAAVRLTEHLSGIWCRMGWYSTSISMGCTPLTIRRQPMMRVCRVGKP